MDNGISRTDSSEVDILADKTKPPTNEIKAFWPIIPAFFFVLLAFVIAVFYKPQSAFKGDTALKPRAVIPDTSIPYLGSIDAPVTVIVLANPGCSNCKLPFDSVESGLHKNYIAKGVIKLYQWPMFNDDSNISQFEALYCAADQNNYWQYREALINSAKDFLLADDYGKIAQQLKLNLADFTSCINSRKYTAWLQQKNKERLDANLNESNLMVLVNDTFLSSPQLEDISAAIDREVSGVK